MSTFGIAQYDVISWVEPNWQICEGEICARGKAKSLENGHGLVEKVQKQDSVEHQTQNEQCLQLHQFIALEPRNILHTSCLTSSSEEYFRLDE